MHESRGPRGTLVTFLLLTAGVLIPFAIMIAPYSLALMMGGILAVLCHPLYRRLRLRGFSPRLASAIVTVAFLILVLAPLTLFTITAVRQTMGLITTLTNTDHGLTKCPVPQFELLGGKVIGANALRQNVSLSANGHFV
jgi:predicted PurR-regulated permease PerM